MFRFKQTKKSLSSIYLLCFGLVVSLSVSGLNRSAVANSTDLLAQEATVDAVSGIAVNLFQAIVLGFVQGATEFIPISSTAHLKVIPVLLGWGDPGVFFFCCNSAWVV